MKKVLVVCPEGRDRRELSLILDRHLYHLVFHEFPWEETFSKLWQNNDISFCAKFDIHAFIETILQELQHQKFDGLISTGDYPGSLLCSVLANELKLPGPSPKAVLQAQHKYCSRLLQQKSVPQAVPDFAVIDPSAPTLPLKYPFFIKPVKACFSAHAQAVHNAEDFRSALNNPTFPRSFLKPFHQLLVRHALKDFEAHHLIVEDLLEGVQCTLDGFISNGKVHTLGIVDSIMYPGTRSFARFEYPSHLPLSLQKKMKDTTSCIIEELGLDNTLFNIEFMVDILKGDIKIIEVNTRMSSQHADLFEKVDGINSYSVALAIATGQQPSYHQGQGKYRVAASCVLRLFQDQMVLRVPSTEEVQSLKQEIPDMRIEVFADEGDRLSEYLQDVGSYRYALIHLGASSWEKLQDTFQRCKERLSFAFSPISL